METKNTTSIQEGDEVESIGATIEEILDTIIIEGKMYANVSLSDGNYGCIDENYEFYGEEGLFAGCEVMAVRELDENEKKELKITDVARVGEVLIKDAEYPAYINLDNGDEIRLEEDMIGNKDSEEEHSCPDPDTCEECQDPENQ